MPDSRAIELAQTHREEQRRQQLENARLQEENQRIEAENARLAEEVRRLREVQTMSG